MWADSKQNMNKRIKREDMIPYISLKRKGEQKKKNSEGNCWAFEYQLWIIHFNRAKEPTQRKRHTIFSTFGLTTKTIYPD